MLLGVVLTEKLLVLNHQHLKCHFEPLAESALTHQKKLHSRCDEDIKKSSRANLLHLVGKICTRGFFDIFCAR